MQRRRYVASQNNRGIARVKRTIPPRQRREQAPSRHPELVLGVPTALVRCLVKCARLATHSWTKAVSGGTTARVDPNAVCGTWSYWTLQVVATLVRATRNVEVPRMKASHNEISGFRDPGTIRSAC
jgi:hypothetical protein